MMVCVIIKEICGVYGGPNSPATCIHDLRPRLVVKPALFMVVEFSIVYTLD